MKIVSNKIPYYGGKKFTSPDILEEIKIIEKMNDTTINESSIAHVVLEDFHSKIEDFKLIGKINEDDNNNSGGEGVVYKTNIKGMVAKIYWPNCRTKVREEKIKFMLNNPVDDPSICWPKGILKINKQFVGFIMPEIDNKIYIKIDPFDGANELEVIFNKNKKNLLLVLLNVMKAFEKLRTYNIVMGDFNFDNILINKNDYSVVLIDLDGAQVGRFPSIGCKSNFNAPEIFIKKLDDDDNEEKTANIYYHKYYSAFDRDNYSLAAYAFMLLILKQPYKIPSHITLKKFCFDLLNQDNTLMFHHQTHSNRWAHLPLFVREAFYTSFTTSSVKERLNPSQWIKVFSRYLKLLDDEQYMVLDPNCCVLYKYEPFDYSILAQFKTNHEFKIQQYGFSMIDTMKRIFNDVSSRLDNCNLDYKMIAEYLNHHRIFKVNKSLEIKLLLNIGVLKKIEAVYKE